MWVYTPHRAQPLPMRGRTSERRRSRAQNFESRFAEGRRGMRN
nr:MAG TPA: hypothetical protein [Caudoviricetes sp.]